MTLVVEVDGVPLPDGALTIRGAPNSGLPGGVAGLPLAAWYGEALTGGYVIDDPDGDYDFTGLHTIVAYETAATSRPFITGGWITGRRVSRGIYKDGPGRIHDVDFIDINWNYALDVFRASSAKRPYETDLARIQFIRESAPMAFTPSHDNGRFNITDNPVNFDESDLVTKYPIEAINEFVGIAGKNFYNYWDNAAEEISIHYDLIGVGPAAGNAISNVIADSDSTTFYPFLDAELDQGPAYTVTSMLLGYRGAYAFGTRQATIDALSPSIFSPIEFHRTEVYTTDRVGRLATAEALIAAMLEQRAVDTDTIKVSIRVPAAQVNDCYPGEIMDVKFTHLPGYESVVQLPIIRRNVVPTAGRVDMYDIHLELSGDGAPTGPGGGDPGEFPNEPPADCSGAINLINTGTGGHTTSATAALGFTATAGNLILIIMASRNTGAMTVTPPPGYTQIAYNRTFNPTGFQDAIVVYGKVAAGGESTVDFSGTVPSRPWPSSAGGNYFAEEWEGLEVPAAFTATNVGSGTALGAPAIPASGVGLAMGIFVQSQDTATTFTPGTGWTQAQEESDGTHPETLIEYKVLTTAAAATPVATSSKNNGWKSISLLLTCSADDGGISTCPPAGTWVRSEDVGMGDGVSDTFSTNCTFADGSLIVYVDRLDQTAAIASYDGAAREFTLDFIPRSTEFIEVDYQGR